MQFVHHFDGSEQIRYELEDVFRLFRWTRRVAQEHHHNVEFVLWVLCILVHMVLDQFRTLHTLVAEQL